MSADGKYEKDKLGKVYQVAVQWLSPPLLLGFTGYGLFEAYRTGEILRWGKGTDWGWISYRSSPHAFHTMVVVDVSFFLLGCAIMALLVWRKTSEK